MEKRKLELSQWLFLLGLFVVSFHLLPALFKRFVYKSLTLGDIFDFVTPWAVISVIFIVFTQICRDGSGERHLRFQESVSKILLGAGFILYVNGHGLHLSANSLARLFDKAQNQEFYSAAYLFDEIISHYMWDVGVFLISMALIFASYRRSYKSLFTQNIVFVYIGAVLFGFSFAVNGIEGQTIVFVVLAALCGVFVTLGMRLKNYQSGRNNPVALFFLVAYLVSLLLFAYWGFRYSGFPQFSELGWI